jgi:methyltransferase (TIGR00027 family)
MLPGRDSRTAEYMALFRALETRRRPADRLFADPLAPAFLGAPLKAAVRLAGLPVVGGVVPWLIDRRVPGPRPSAVARTRLIDDALTAAIAQGVRQLLILGAGYDSRAYRIPGAQHLQVFEVDHPDTQAVKRRVVERVLGHPPAHVRFVPIDFDRQPLAEILVAAGVSRGSATFTIWEGVASYLTPAAVDATVRCASELSGAGSELVLTYVDRGLLDGSVRFPHAGPWVRSVERAGEPFVFGFHPRELGAYLSERGWQLVQDRSTAEALAAYGAASRRVPGFYRVARART